MIVSNRDIAAQVRLVLCQRPNVLHSSSASHRADHPPKACSIASAGVVHPEGCLAELLAARTVARVHRMGCHYMERTARATIWPEQKARRKTVQYVVSTRRKGMGVRPSLAPRTGHFTGWYQTQGVAVGCACVCGLYQPHPPSTAAPRHGLTFRNLKHMCCKVTGCVESAERRFVGHDFPLLHVAGCCLAVQGKALEVRQSATIGTIHICTYMPYICACMFRFSVLCSITKGA